MRLTFKQFERAISIQFFQHPSITATRHLLSLLYNINKKSSAKTLQPDSFLKPKGNKSVINVEERISNARKIRDL